MCKTYIERVTISIFEYWIIIRIITVNYTFMIRLELYVNVFVTFLGIFLVALILLRISREIIQKYDECLSISEYFYFIFLAIYLNDFIETSEKL